MLALVLLLVLACVIGLAACSKKEAVEELASDGVEVPVELETLVPGKLTVATGQPAYPPWVEDDEDLESGKGFEVAVTYALAEKLGFAHEDVIWVRTDFEAAIAPGPKDFDLNIQQFSITEERRQVVDFSTPYYVTSQAVVVNADSKFADADSLEALQGAKVGAAAGSTSLEVAQDKFKDVAVFNDNDAAVQALSVGQIDAIVADIPTAYYMIGAQLDDGKLLGEIEGSVGGDELAFLLPKDSPLTAPVSAALDELRADGTLDRLAAEWLVESAGAIVLR